MERAECSYPNTILIGREGRQHADKPEEGELEGSLEHSEEVDKIEDILTRIHADNSEFILRTANQS